MAQFLTAVDILPTYDFWNLLEPEMGPAFTKAKAKAKRQAIAA
jgi:hypothetical protein